METITISSGGKFHLMQALAELLVTKTKQHKDAMSALPGVRFAPSDYAIPQIKELIEQIS